MRTFVFVCTLALAALAMAGDVVDVHCHLITPEYTAHLKRHGALLDEGFPVPKWNVESHLAWMDAAGVETSVLTLASPQPMFGDKEENRRIVRSVNETAARLKAENPGRFLFCAALPQDDVAAAMDEVRYALDTLHADGVKLATNVQGVYLGAEKLDPLMALLNERKAVVILHPCRPEPVSRDVMRQTPLAMQEFLSETTRAVCNMISRNVPARYPNIRFVAPHCGAYLPLAIPRMKSLTPVMQKNGLVGEIDYDACLKSFWFDLAGAHSPETIRELLTITTPDRLMFGSDFPYVAPAALNASLERMKGYLDAQSDLKPYKDMILKDNALALFGIAPLAKKNASNREDVFVRIAEIEVYPEWLKAYLAAAQKVGAESVAKEPGVICIFPMQQKERPCVIRIVEIYRSESAYKTHLATPHFRTYKEGTPHMIKSLSLVPMTPLDEEGMKLIFSKETTR